MPTLVYTDAFVSINGVDLSNHVKSVNITYEAEMLDDTVMGTSGTRSNKPGLKNWSIEASFLQDHDPGSVDETLFPLVGAPAFPVAVRPSKTNPVGPTNPEYGGNGVLETYPPLTGEVGALGTAQCTIRCASDLMRDSTTLLQRQEDENRFLNEDEKKLPAPEKRKLVDQRKREEEEKKKAGNGNGKNKPAPTPGPPAPGAGPLPTVEPGR
jgi:hypothetical protein